MKNYTRIGVEEAWHESYEGCYQHTHARYFRYPHTQNELRQLRCLVHDGLPVRRKRLHIPTCYDDPQIGRNYGRSWKDYTKKRHQWEDRR